MHLVLAGQGLFLPPCVVLGGVSDRDTDSIGIRCCIGCGLPVLLAVGQTIKMNHKRKKPKNARAGCLMCKFWKVNGYPKEAEGGEKFSDHRRRRKAKDEMKEP